MTIVEIIDYFNGFYTIKNFIKTKRKKGLLWIFSILAFMLSAIIDNLTATIVLMTILQKVVIKRDTRLWFAGLIILAANAGGAWSPIGDVTTTMLWIGDKVTTFNLISYVLIPSVVCLVVPVFIASFLPAFQGEIVIPKEDNSSGYHKHGARMLYLGLSAIIFVPVFKMITHLPPYVGMMLSLAIVATFAEIFSKSKINITSIDAVSDAHQTSSPVHSSLSKIELPSILFFLGILLAVAALESLGLLFNFAEGLNGAIPNTDIVVSLLGIASAVIDNVPLVAASMGMFSMPIDDPIWHLIAYSAGTGGSMLVIGSAAGVVAMGMEKIDFFWYFKKITWLALMGFISGFITFIVMRDFIL
jgi:Na+/H+ antiporter NhaD/arsenite permease-like protein